MSSALAYLLGAGTAIVTQSFLTLYVAPHADARKRRESRFEEDVKELGELVSGELSDLALKGASSARANAVMVETEGDTLTEGQRKILGDFFKEARDREDAYRSLSGGRIRLLADRIVGYAPDAPRLHPFSQAARMLRVVAPRSATFVTFDARVTSEEVDKEWTREQARRTALIAETAKLSSMTRPPRVGLLRKVRLKIKRSEPVARLGRWQAARQVARENRKTA